MICDRSESVRFSRWWFRALVSVSCVFCGCVRGWIVDLGPRLGLRERIVLHVFYECFGIVCVRACVDR